MNKTLLTAVSAFALLAVQPANAESPQRTPGQSQSQQVSPQHNTTNESGKDSLSENAKEAWKDTKQGARNAAGTVAGAVQDTYKDIKQAFSSEDDKINIQTRMTLDGIIGEPVYNESGDRVAKVRDIIFDKDGNATMVVLADGAFLGLGKLAAFEYDVITRRTAEGDVLSSLTETMIDQAAAFSYDRTAASSNVRVISANGFSGAEMLDGYIVDPKGNELADIENISLKEGRADQLIIALNEVLGLGGEMAAISLDQVDLVRDGDQVNFQLSESEAQQFIQFKKNATH